MANDVLAHLLGERIHEVFIFFESIKTLQHDLIKRLELDDSLHPELFDDAIDLVWLVHAGVTDPETEAVHDLHLVDGVVDAGRLDIWIWLFLAFLELHAFDIDEHDLIVVLEVVLVIVKQSHKTLFFVRNLLDHAVLELFTVLVQYLEVSKVIEETAKDTLEITVDELLALGAAVVVDCRHRLVICFSEDEDIDSLEVPWLFLVLCRI